MKMLGIGCSIPRLACISMSRLREVFETLVRITHGYRYLGNVGGMVFMGYVILSFMSGDSKVGRDTNNKIVLGEFWIDSDGDIFIDPGDPLKGLEDTYRLQKIQELQRLTKKHQ